MSAPGATPVTADATERREAGQNSRGEASQPHHGQVHVVPAQDFVGSSGWLAETLYRIVEITASAIGLVASLPILLIAAVLVRYESPGPILFLHRRPARSVLRYGRDLGGRVDLVPPAGGFEPDALYLVPSYFTLIKFRTMYADSRTRFPELYRYSFTETNFHQQFPTPHPDPRVTRVGRILRKLSVDELPNLWSVVIGDIRLVGPRPEAPEVLQYYTPQEMYKFACKPGITGLAQINGRGLLTWGETLAWDLKYVRTRSVSLDLKIIVLTLWKVVTRFGAF
jgi:lipopolysaccharide/colanic/teichoic acid biosynthesis glycosyltransferase